MKRVNLRDVDGPWDFAVVLLGWLRVNWAKAVFIFAVIAFSVALTVCGFTVSCGKGSFVKDPMPIRGEVGE